MSAYVYRPIGAPTRHMRTAPAVVREKVLDIVRIDPPQPLDFDVLLRPEPGEGEFVGVDFAEDGGRGCHFFLTSWQARQYRERNRSRRVGWHRLPDETRQAILRYLEE